MKSSKRYCRYIQLNEHSLPIAMKTKTDLFTQILIFLFNRIRFCVSVLWLFFIVIHLSPAIAQSIATTYSIDNTASVTYTTNGEIKNVKSNTVHATKVIDDDITVTKTVTSLQTGLNTYELTYNVIVENTGVFTVDGVRVIDNLDCTFDMDTISRPVSSWKIVVSPTTQNNLLTINQNYTGKADNHGFCDRNLLAKGKLLSINDIPTQNSLSLTTGTDSLKSGDKEIISFIVEVTSDTATQSVTNTVFVASKTTVDVAQTFPPTPISNKPPIIDTKKEVNLRRLPDDIKNHDHYYALDYKITVTNTSLNTDADFLTVIDNLDCTFYSDNSIDKRLVKSWAVYKDDNRYLPKITLADGSASPIPLNHNHTGKRVNSNDGKGLCDRSIWNSPNIIGELTKEGNFPLDQSLNLVMDGYYLKAQQAIVISFTVKIAVAVDTPPALLAKEFNPINHVIVGAFYYKGHNGTKKSATRRAGVDITMTQSNLFNSDGSLIPNATVDTSKPSATAVHFVKAPVAENAKPSEISVNKTVKRTQISSDVYQLTYNIHVQNTGNTDLDAVKLMDNLNCSFDSDTSNSSVLNWAIVTPPASQNNVLTINKNYTGKINNSVFCDRRLPVGKSELLELSTTELLNKREQFPKEDSLNLLSGNNTLKVGEKETITFTVQVTDNPANEKNAVNTVFAVSNQAVNVAESVTLPADVSVTKSVTSQQTGFGTYELTYDITVENSGALDVNAVRVVDNLDCTFDMDNASHPVTSWRFINKPTIDSNRLTLNQNYTGKVDNKGSCDRTLLAKNTLNMGDISVQDSISLTTGTDTLKSGDKAVIHFVVEVISNSINESVINTVFVASDKTVDKAQTSPPTPIANKPPTLDVTKEVTLRRLNNDTKTQDRVYALDYKVTVTNTSTNGVNADFLTVIDNLDCTFEMDKPENQRLVKSWLIDKSDTTHLPNIELVGSSSSPVPLNHNHTGKRVGNDNKGLCDRSIWDSNDVLSELMKPGNFPIDQSLNLVVDNHYLKPAQTIVISFTVKVNVDKDINPSLLTAAHNPKNAVLVGSFFYKSDETSKKFAISRAKNITEQNNAITEQSNLVNSSGSVVTGAAPNVAAAAAAAAADTVPALITEDLKPSDIQVTKSVKASQTGFNTYNLDYSVTVENTGTTDINTLNLIDNLDCTFNSDVNNSAITHWELTTKPSVQNDILKANANYSGKANNNGFCDRSLLSKDGVLLISENQLNAADISKQSSLNLISTSNTFKSGAKEVIHFSVAITTNSTNAQIINTVFATTNKSVKVAQTIPATPVPNEYPQLNVEKSSTYKATAEKNVYELTYTVDVENISAVGVNANFVTVIDNLDCTFNMDMPESTRYIKSWDLIDTPQVANMQGDSVLNSTTTWLKPNENYKGYIKRNADNTGECDRHQLKETPSEISKHFPLNADINLVDGEHLLKAKKTQSASGEKVRITFPIRVVVNPAFKDIGTIQNKVFAGAFFYNENAKPISMGDENYNGSKNLIKGAGNNATTAAAAATDAANDKVIKLQDSNIQITKSVSSKATGVDSYELTYTINVKNDSQNDLNDVQVLDNLDCAFDRDKSDKPISSWNIIESPKAQNSLLTINKNYTSKSGVNSCTTQNRALLNNTNLLTLDNTDLLAQKNSFPDASKWKLASGHLKAGQDDTITFKVQVISQSETENVINTAFVLADNKLTGVAQTAAIPVYNSKTVIETDKAVQITSEGNDKYRFAYQINVTNKSNHIAHFVRLVDNLDCAFKTGHTQLIKSWELDESTLSTVNNYLKVNSHYNGKKSDGSCDVFSNQVTLGSSGFLNVGTELDTFSKMMNNPSLNLIDGNHYLNPNQTETIKFDVIVTIDATKIEDKAIFKNYHNTVFATHYFSEDLVYNTDGEQISDKNNTLNPLFGNPNLVLVTSNDKTIPYGDALNNTVLDTASLILSKSASKTVAELVDFVDFTLTLTNNTGQELKGYTLTDTLPLGFAYELNSSSLVIDDKAQHIDNPAGGRGRVLTWTNTETVIPIDGIVVLSYRTSVGVGATQGDGINRAVAKSQTNDAHKTLFNSIEATAKVQVTGGVFSDEGFIVGKVFTDCNGDRLQGHEEIGVPGVRVYLEDGTYAISDVEGKYSFYAVKAVTHVLKVDNSTLPQGALLVPLSNRNSGRGDSQFVDMKKGELHKADFAIHVGNGRTEKLNCDKSPVIEEVQRRRAALVDKPSAEVDYVLRTRLASQTTSSSMSNPIASGIVGQTNVAGVQMVNPMQTALAPSPQQVKPFNPVMPSDMSVMRPSALPDKAVAKLPKVSLEEQITKLDNTLDFIDLKDKNTLPIAQGNVRVKGTMGVVFKLFVNDIEINQRRVGKRSKLADKQMEAWEFIGVDFKAGSNTLKLQQFDPMGNRGEKIINVIAPDVLGKLELDLPAVAIADGNTAVHMKLRLTDANGVPVTARTQVTLEVDKGRWITEDINATEPGTQIFIEGGVSDIVLMPPNQPSDGTIVLSSGIIKHEVKIAFLPELRPLIGSGILEGILDLRRLGNGSLTNARPKDAFEKELTNFAESSNDGKVKVSGRAAFFFKGTVQGKYLLTTAYDSDKSTHDRLFRDIRPDQYYPIYGDSATKGFDAQSTSRLYVRIDKDKSYLLYGDYTTAGNTDVRQITQYNRSLTGVKGHYEDERFNVTGFYSRNNSVQVVEEIPANGTSGPYELNQINNNYIENSERVEIITRDRNQSGVILASNPQTRFSDYNIDPLSKRLLFRGPVPSMDSNLNPQYIRVTYETGSNNGFASSSNANMGGSGAKFGIAGVDAQVKVTDKVQLGVIAIKDENPANKAQMGGVTAVIKLADKTVLNGEFAHTDNELHGSGNAERIELKHDGEDLKARAQYSNVGGSFYNQSSFGMPGRTEIPATAEYRLTPNTKLKAEAIYSKDNVNGGYRKGVLGNVVTRVADGVDVEMGVRASITDGGINSSSCVSSKTLNSQCNQVATSGISQFIRNELLTVRSKITTQVPWVDGMQAYIEAEQDVRDIQKRLLALGSNYQLNEKTRLYGRYQLASTLGSQFNLNSFAPTNVGMVGIESAYIKGGNLYNEYRLRDGQNGREASTALGLRNTWLIDEGFRVGAGFETTKSFNGVAGQNSNSLTGTLEYFADARYRASASLELRKSDMSDSLLNTLALSYKIDKDWSFLARNYFSIMDNKGSATIWQTQQQLGLAFRQVDTNVWNALMQYQHKYQSGLNSNSSGSSSSFTGVTGSGVSSSSSSSLATINSTTDTHIVSTHLNYQADADVILSSRYAAKLSSSEYLGLSSMYWAQLVYGRATWDFLPKWDASVQVGGYLGKGDVIQYAAGVEVGYQVIDNLWLSVGYNVSGIHDGDLTNNAYLDNGVYVRGRFKFDENSLSFFQ